MNKEDLYHKIESYLLDNMSDEESRNFERELENNSSLKDEFELHKQLHSHYNQENIDNEIPDNKYTQELKVFIDSEEAKQIKEKLKIAKQKYASTQKTSKPKPYLKLVAAAIILTMISRVGYEFLKKPNLYNDYYSQNDLPSLVKRDNSQNELYKGLEFFNTSEFDAAIQSFEKYKTSETQIDSLMFLYLGTSYLQLDQYNNAIKNFDIISNSQLLDKSRGLWFKALTYLKVDDKENARIVLEMIIKKPSNFKYNEAIDLLNEL